jgi:hypothetical protein
MQWPRGASPPHTKSKLHEVSSRRPSRFVFVLQYRRAEGLGNAEDELTPSNDIGRAVHLRKLV